MAKTKEEPQKPAAPVWTAKDQEQLLRNALASAPTVHEVLGKPEHYEKWYQESRKVLENG